ncbi:hypothetical protein ACFQPG_02020 [Sphingomonas sp. GCM10030256]|uniref:hypothetical protein n=1 Tax=Sphingomonas sp. GCM10030256 TaxID=3273427 RepID=UPI00361CBFC7
MRLLVLPVLILLSGAAPSTPAPSAPPPQRAEPARAMPAITPGGPQRADCPETAATLARREGGRLQPRTLGEMPGADHYAAVYRRIGGCEVPLVVSYNVGGRSPAAALREQRR